MPEALRSRRVGRTLLRVALLLVLVYAVVVCDYLRAAGVIGMMILERLTADA